MASNQQPMTGILAPIKSRPSNQQPLCLVLVDANGNAFSAGSVLLTGFAAHAVGALAAADTVNVALAKLEARVVALETA